MGHSRSQADADQPQSTGGKLAPRSKPEGAVHAAALIDDPSYYVDADNTASVYWLEGDELICAAVGADDTVTVADSSEGLCSVAFDLIEPDAAGHAHLVQALLLDRRGEAIRAREVREEARKRFIEAEETGIRAWNTAPPHVFEYLPDFSATE